MKATDNVFCSERIIKVPVARRRRGDQWQPGSARVRREAESRKICSVLAPVIQHHLLGHLGVCVCFFSLPCKLDRGTNAAGVKQDRMIDALCMQSVSKQSSQDQAGRSRGGQVRKNKIPYRSSLKCYPFNRSLHLLSLFIFIKCNAFDHVEIIM